MTEWTHNRDGSDLRTPCPPEYGVNPPKTRHKAPMSGTPRHTFVISDVHVADGEAPDPHRPLWRRYKDPAFFVDDSLTRFLDHARTLAGHERAELVLNGDIFDFDCVAVVPDDAPFRVSWLERARGLSAEEPKAVWKLTRILDDHPVLLAELRRWLLDGNDVAYVIGNHDLEMHWPAAQALVRHRLALPPDCPGELRFCAWFTISGGDTLVTHGNQLDPYCLCHDPLHPFIEVHGTTRVRLPFGDYAGKFLSNGIGWFNPHVESTYVKSPLEWFWFFYQHVVRQQPFILGTWLWSSVAALWASLRDGLRPALRDPLTLDDRVEEVARDARTTPKVVRAMHEVRAHPAVYRPLMVARELWLDRFFLLVGILVISLQAVSTLHLFAGVSGWWMIVLFAVLLPPFVFYTASVDSDVRVVSRNIHKRLALLARITRTDKVVMGHTHDARHERIGDVEYANTGHWAPGFSDMACTQPEGVRGFTWIHPDGAGGRRMELREWTDPDSVALPVVELPVKKSALERLRPKLPWRRKSPTEVVPGS